MLKMRFSVRELCLNSGFDGARICAANKLSPKGSRFLMESPVMSDHHLRFKGPGFDFDAKGWMAILAAIVIVGIVVRFWH